MYSSLYVGAAVAACVCIAYVCTHVCIMTVELRVKVTPQYNRHRESQSWVATAGDAFGRSRLRTRPTRGTAQGRAWHGGDSAWCPWTGTEPERGVTSAAATTLRHLIDYLNACVGLNACLSRHVSCACIHLCMYVFLYVYCITVRTFLRVYAYECLNAFV